MGICARFRQPLNSSYYFNSILFNLFPKWVNHESIVDADANRNIINDINAMHSKNGLRCSEKVINNTIDGSSDIYKLIN